MGRFLILGLVAAAGLLRADDVFTGVERIVAVGDVHGDYKQFLTVLQDAGVVDNRGRWTGGKTHLVQTGDIPDRGPDTRKALDLLMELEKQAARAGGAVHALIGNHEAMNIYGDLRYATPEEFAAFRSPNSASVRENFWTELAKQDPTKANDQEFKTKWYAEHPPGWFEQRVEYGPQGKYGKWIRGHNAVVQVNDTLFLHAGISPVYADSSVAAINQKIRKELTDFSLLNGGAATAQDGPLWYRGLAQGDEQELAAHVDAVLAHYGVKRIVIGHTVTGSGGIVSRFGGKVVQIDAGMSKAYGQHRACLVIENGQPLAIEGGVKRPLTAMAAAAAP